MRAVLCREFGPVERLEVAEVHVFVSSIAFA